MHMRRIAKFHKVSKEQFQKDWIDTFGENGEQGGTPEDIYQEIKLPRRAPDRQAMIFSRRSM